MHLKKPLQPQLTPWDDRDTTLPFAFPSPLPLLQPKQKSTHFPSHSKQTSTSNFHSITNPRQMSTTFTKLSQGFTLYNKYQSIKSLKSTTIYSRKPSLVNNKVLFPIKTSTVHIKNIKENVENRYKGFGKINTSSDEILTICNNSLIKIKLGRRRNRDGNVEGYLEGGNRNRRINRCKVSLIHQTEKCESSSNDRSLNTSMVKNSSKGKYKKASLLKIKSLLLS